MYHSVNLCDVLIALRMAFGFDGSSVEGAVGFSSSNVSGVEGLCLDGNDLLEIYRRM